MASEETLAGIGARLKWLRESLGINQVEWARALGIRPSQLHKWENGHQAPNLDVLIRIDEATNCTLDYIIGGKLTKSMDDDLYEYLHENYLRYLRLGRVNR